MPCSMPSTILLPGSINVKDAREAFTLTANVLGSKVKYLPDGETGERLGWIVMHFDRLPARIKKSNWLASGQKYDLNDPESQRKDPDPPLEDHEFLPLEYDKEAVKSYKLFCELREQGLIHQGQKFQVSIPSAMNFMNLVAPMYGRAAEPFIERRIAECLKGIQDHIPAEDLCIHWDMPNEILAIERPRMEENMAQRFAPYWATEKTLQHIGDMNVRLCSQIKPEVEIGMHLCYGTQDPKLDFDLWMYIGLTDTNRRYVCEIPVHAHKVTVYEANPQQHKHFIEPIDAGALVKAINTINKAVSPVHKISFFHVPVPKERDDVAYFEPLTDLQFEGDLYLGLAREGDEEGSQRRLATARKVLDRDFGVSTECGMGRVPAELVQSAMQIMNGLTTA